MSFLNMYLGIIWNLDPSINFMVISFLDFRESRSADDNETLNDKMSSVQCAQEFRNVCRDWLTASFIAHRSPALLLAN